MQLAPVGMKLSDAKDKLAWPRGMWEGGTIKMRGARVVPRVSGIVELPGSVTTSHSGGKIIDKEDVHATFWHLLHR